MLCMNKCFADTIAGVLRVPSDTIPGAGAARGDCSPARRHAVTLTSAPAQLNALGFRAVFIITNSAKEKETVTLYSFDSFKVYEYDEDASYNGHEDTFGALKKKRCQR
ncbi:hypothetical protein KGM_201943 [Danaus plexippus plexippus]|uniref:Uncharacterized protein n=1 Tax=Danaus plexippus plexippus TaxID=278856 RepID=A0A212ESN7_DANPL|nr:hypothetical protein KGM_201943 [Danaus plexippus plexippus]